MSFITLLIDITARRSRLPAAACLPPPPLMPPFRRLYTFAAMATL